MGSVGFMIPLFNLLASFRVLARTGNLTITLRYDILELNNFFFSKLCRGTFPSFLWNSDNLGDASIDFFSENQVTRRQTNKRIGTSRPLALRKIETARHLHIKKRDNQTHTTAKKNETTRP